MRPAAETNELRTARILLRRWKDSDREPFATVNSDECAMRYLPTPLARGQSDRMIENIEAGFERHGYGLWALELRDSGEFIGFTGLMPVAFRAHFTPAVEIGWRLARSAWGHGYATEAARAALEFGFGVAGLEQIVAMTSVENARSRAVMERIAMNRDPADDFEHPLLEPGARLRPHVLYRAFGAGWLAGSGA